MTAWLCCIVSHCTNDAVVYTIVIYTKRALYRSRLSLLCFWLYNIQHWLCAASVHILLPSVVIAPSHNTVYSHSLVVCIAFVYFPRKSWSDGFKADINFWPLEKYIAV